MRRHKFFTDRVIEIQKGLNRWARKHGVTEKDERIVIMTRVESGHEFWKMSPEDFFSVIRLVANGMTHPLAARVHNAIRQGNWYLEGGQSSPYGWFAGTKRKVTHKTMEEFLSCYNDVSELFKLKNLGRLSIIGMVKIIRESGMHIGDSQGLLDQ